MRDFCDPTVDRNQHGIRIPQSHANDEGANSDTTRRKFATRICHYYSGPRRTCACTNNHASLTNWITFILGYEVYHSLPHCTQRIFQQTRASIVCPWPVTTPFITAIGTPLSSCKCCYDNISWHQTLTNKSRVVVRAEPRGFYVIWILIKVSYAIIHGIISIPREAASFIKAVRLLFVYIIILRIIMYTKKIVSHESI